MFVKKIINILQARPGMKIADLGCGTRGSFVFSLAPLIEPAGRVYAVDIMKEVLESIKKRAVMENWDNIQPIWSDLEQFGALPVESASLDRVLMVNTLFQLDNRWAGMRESARILKHGGIFLIAEKARSPIPQSAENNSLVSEDWLMSAGQKSGLTMIDRKKIDNTHYAILFTKV